MNALNNEGIVWAFNRNTMSINALAGRLDVSNDIVEGILRGTVNIADLRLSTLITLGELLGVPLHAMFKQPDPLPGDPAPPSPVDDAERLIACIYDRADRTAIADIAAAFGWSIDRFNEAADHGSARLASIGLRLYRSDGKVRINPLRDHTAARRALRDREATEQGLAAHHYKAAYEVLTHGAVKTTTSGLPLVAWRHRL